ncbi:MarC family protein [Melioribacteraceae bacterium 4301-Me]|uniref:MarC family protein n=1 Tax=Pyranulibacter aquaticus TaxID=3163344 RepID=UPI003598284B
MDINIFLLTFIPLFVAMDIIGTTPIFIGFTQGISSFQRKRLIIEACLAAFIVAIAFLFGGKAVLRFLGITINDFRIAGGMVLLTLSIYDILSTASDSRRNPHTNVGVVPLGIPLIMGPAALTTILILVDKYGYIPTIISMLSNFIIVVLVLVNAKWVAKVLGEGGTKAFAKIASLFLAAYAVMMIREGINIIIENFKG